MQKLHLTNIKIISKIVLKGNLESLHFVQASDRLYDSSDVAKCWFLAFLSSLGPSSTAPPVFSFSSPAPGARVDPLYPV